MNKSSSQPIISIFEDVDEPDLPTFYSQATFDNALLNCSQKNPRNAYLEYQNTHLNHDEDVSLQKASKRSKETSKNTGNVKNKTFDNEQNSYIIKNIQKFRRIIKISISNLELENEAKEVALQYVAEEDCDEILNAAEELVHKIVKKLSC